ncbi:hypothetical protein AMTRI_Chr08g204920 [Amborella trichopoda]
MMRLFEIEWGLKLGKLPFIDKHIYNFVCAINNVNHDIDVHILLTKGWSILFGPMVLVLMHMRSLVKW